MKVLHNSKQLLLTLDIYLFQVFNVLKKNYNTDNVPAFPLYDPTLSLNL